MKRRTYGISSNFGFPKQGKAFLDASSHLYKRCCPSVGRSVRPFVGRSVMLLSKLMKNGPLQIVNDLDRAGRGKKRDEEEGGTGRKEGRGE